MTDGVIERRWTLKRHKTTKTNNNKSKREQSRAITTTTTTTTIDEEFYAEDVYNLTIKWVRVIYIFKKKKIKSLFFFIANF